MASEIYREGASRELDGAVVYEEGRAEDLFHCYVGACSAPCREVDDLHPDGSWSVRPIAIETASNNFANGLAQVRLGEPGETRVEGYLQAGSAAGGSTEVRFAKTA